MRRPALKNISYEIKIFTPVACINGNAALHVRGADRGDH